jgi:hypothetical protein
LGQKFPRLQKYQKACYQINFLRKYANAGIFGMQIYLLATLSNSIKLIQFLGVAWAPLITVACDGGIPDGEVPQPLEDVLVLGHEVEAHVVLEKAVDHRLEGVQVRQVLVAGRVLRPEQLLVRLALDQALPALDKDLGPML